MVKPNSSLATAIPASVPKVSIICPTYNHEAFIEKALKSFLDQKTSFPFEIIVRDDASTDRTPDIIDDYKNRYPSLIRVIRHSINQFQLGVRAAPELIQASRGAYIAFCEGDDYWCDSEKLSDQIRVIESDINCVLVGAMAYIWEDKSPTPYSIEPPFNQSTCSATKSSDFFFGSDSWLHTSTRVWKKQYLERFYRDNPNPNHQYDLGQVLYVLADASKGKVTIRMLNRVSSVYRRHCNGVHTGISYSSQTKAALKIRIHMIKYFQSGPHRRRQQQAAASELIAYLRYWKPTKSLQSLSVFKAFAVATQDNPLILAQTMVLALSVLVYRAKGPIMRAAKTLLRRTP